MQDTKALMVQDTKPLAEREPHDVLLEMELFLRNERFWIGSTCFWTRPKRKGQRQYVFFGRERVKTLSTAKVLSG